MLQQWRHLFLQHSILRFRVLHFSVCEYYIDANIHSLRSDFFLDDILFLRGSQERLQIEYDIKNHEAT